MNLSDRIKAIAKTGGISGEELIFDEMGGFMLEHERHLELEVRIKYSLKLEIVRIRLVCYSDIYSITLYDRGIASLEFHRKKDRYTKKF